METGSALRRIRSSFLDVTGVLLALLVATAPRKIWIDEFLGFAFAAYPNWTEAMGAIEKSLHGVNFGQTGIYFILNRLFLDLGGAHYMLLRLPTAVAFVSVFFFGGRLLRQWGGGAVAVCVFWVLMLIHPLNLDLSREARPYILLQATAVGFLWAWNRHTEKKGWVALSLFAGLGILSHPYFALYAAAFVSAGFVIFPHWRAAVARDARAKEFWIFGILSGMLLYFVGRFSWFNSLTMPSNIDPFEWVGRDRSLARIYLGHLFAPAAIPIVVGTVSLFLGAVALGERALIRKFAFLWLVTILTGAVLIWSSVRGNYWILPRQWIGSVAMGAFVAALTAGHFVRRVSSRFQMCEKWAQCAISVLLLMGIGWFLVRWYPRGQLPPANMTREEIRSALAGPRPSPEQYVEWAHQNLMLGGKVESGFARYYREMFE